MSRGSGRGSVPPGAYGSSRTEMSFRCVAREPGADLVLLATLKEHQIDT